MSEVRWERYPRVAQAAHARAWLALQANLGRAANTVEAYGRALEDFLRFSARRDVDPAVAGREHVALYVRDLLTRPNPRGANVRVLDSGVGLANATLQQRLTAVRLYYDYLVEEGVRTSNPAGRGRYTPGRVVGGASERGLVPRYRKLPWIPTDEQWRAVLEAARAEPPRNRLMLALAYDAGLRREELCSLETGDVDPATRLLRIRAETTKVRRERVVPYSEPTGLLYAAYLRQRRELSRDRGRLFLSESRRNRAQPISLWTWSKVVERLAARADVRRFSTHTPRHLCLTDLARAGWGVHEIAQFAGHRNPQTTLLYIHLSGRELAAKLELGADLIAVAHVECATVNLRHGLRVVAHALVALGILAASPLAEQEGDDTWLAGTAAARADVPDAWATWCGRWFRTSPLARKSRQAGYYYLLKVGRWLRDVHPEAASPEAWTRELAAEYVAAVDRMLVGEWTHAPGTCRYAERLGMALKARTKDRQLGSARAFFADCQEWGWLPRRFDPQRALATPRPVRALIGPDPRVIADDVWAKLLWAGLNLNTSDLPAHRATGAPWYPPEMARAVAVLWLFAGLRVDELTRLRVGCIRWQREDVASTVGEDAAPKDAVCLLDVPAHKTGLPFTKPVDRAVGEAVAAWERVRPAQPLLVDPKTGEAVQLLFSYRGQRMSRGYVNRVLIPLLCRKANVPTTDARGSITSHRARSTIASQLFNAKEPMTLFELQEWLGHRSPVATQQYAKIAPTKLAKAYADAGYFGRNVRTIEVLIDQDAIKSGAAATGEPWRFYDLGHGYCTYDFFDQCPHRMACARCTFYRPKPSSQDQLLEARANLLRLKQEIPLTDDECAAVDDGLAALERLCTDLADVPTPAGPTPRQLGNGSRLELPVLPADTPNRSATSGSSRLEQPATQC